MSENSSYTETETKTTETSHYEANTQRERSRTDERDTDRGGSRNFHAEQGQTEQRSYNNRGTSTEEQGGARREGSSEYRRFPSDRTNRGDKPYYSGRKYGAYQKKIDRIETYRLIIDYKRPDVLRKFVSEKGRVLPRRITGNSAKNQRRLIKEIKRARFMAFLSFA